MAGPPGRIPEQHVSDPARFLDRLGRRLGRAGLNHLGVVGVARHDAAVREGARAAALHPGTRSVVVVGSGGRVHWEAFLAHLAVDPARRLARERDPLDRFGEAVMEGLRAEGLLEGCAVFYPHVRAEPRLDFVTLGELAGLGRRSHLGLLVSERWGPWLGLRAAIFTPHELPESAPAPDPCAGCPAPCRSACPPKVAGPGRFAWRRCALFRRLPLAPCRVTCTARGACVIAPGEAYGEPERRYHERRAVGRAELCARLGVRDEVGP